jgi:hypothetical protein
VQLRFFMITVHGAEDAADDLNRFLAGIVSSVSTLTFG